MIIFSIISGEWLGIKDKKVDGSAASIDLNLVLMGYRMYLLPLEGEFLPQ
jgi:hypothetical protein